MLPVVQRLISLRLRSHHRSILDQGACLQQDHCIECSRRLKFNYDGIRLTMQLWPFFAQVQAVIGKAHFAEQG